MVSQPGVVGTDSGADDRCDRSRGQIASPPAGNGSCGTALDYHAPLGSAGGVLRMAIADRAPGRAVQSSDAMATAEA